LLYSCIILAAFSFLIPLFLFPLIIFS
jgi:hypothetical protein